MAWSLENLKDSSLIPRLKWAWHSPPLLQESASGEARMRELLSPPTHWSQAAEQFRSLHSQRKTERLGETFEMLIRSILETHPQVAHVVPNLLLPQGEIDLLWSTRGQPHEFTAVELAVKFYLHDPAVLAPELRWIGPGRKDFLFRKVRRIFDLQLPRARDPEALNQLKRRCTEALAITDSIAWVRGSLFAAQGLEIQARKDLTLCPELSSEVPLFPLLLGRLDPPIRGNWLLDRWQWICEVNDIQEPAPQEKPWDQARAQMVLLDAGTPQQRRAFVAPPGWSHGQP